MNEIVFLANDPGGLDVIWPLFKRMRQGGYVVELLLTGSAAKKEPAYRVNEEDVLKMLGTKCCDYILVTGTSWHSEIEISAIAFCKEKGIKTVAILDYWSNYKERFRFKEGYVFPDYYFVMDELAKKEAIEDGVPPEIIRITGSPGLDKYIDKHIVCEGNDAVFLSQPLSVLYGNSLGYTEYSVMDELIKVTDDMGIHLDVKFHPKDALEFREKYSKIKVDMSLENICARYKYIIGMSTMALLQCALMGGNVISYQPGLKAEDGCITNKLGITRKLTTLEGLVGELKNMDMKNNKFLPFWSDGRSTERCVKQLIKVKLIEKY